MIRFFNVLFGLTIWLVFFAAGGALIHAWIPGVTQTAFDFMPVLQSWKSAVLGIFMVLISLLYLRTLAPRRPKSRYISFDSGNGAVSVSLSAVRDFVRKLGDEFGAVVGIDPKIRSAKEHISMDLDVKVQAGTRIPEFTLLLKERIREGIRDGLGIADVDIEVRIVEIVGTPRPPRRD